MWGQRPQQQHAVAVVGAPRRRKHSDTAYSVPTVPALLLAVHIAQLPIKNRFYTHIFNKSLSFNIGTS